MNDRTDALEIKNLTVSFRTDKGTVHAVRDISLTLAKGETLAIVGESGSGKSVSAKAILGIESANAVIESGKILYGGEDLLTYSEKDFERIRGKQITMIFQDPMSSLDPIMKIGPQITEATILNNRMNRARAARQYKERLIQLRNQFIKEGIKPAETRKEMQAFTRSLSAKKTDEQMLRRFNETAERIRAQEFVEQIRRLAEEKNHTVTKKMAYDSAIQIMNEVGIHDPELRFNQYPFEFSGGMRQRIVIAIAIAANPDLLICDEPTTALDVTIQAQILELINRLKQSRGMSVIFITHDLGVVANVADRIAVMYAGKIVETGTAKDIFYSPAHPYTWALLASMPDLDTAGPLESIPGTPPDMRCPPQGDAFAARNRYAMQIDFEQQPPMFRISDTHYAATWLLHPDAPPVSMPQNVAARIERMRQRSLTQNQTEDTRNAQ